MSLESDIKQNKPFKSLVEKTFVNLMYTSNWSNDKQNAIFKKYDLTSQQYNVLRILNGHSPQPITINGIIERMLDKMSNASRLVDKLLQKKLAQRTTRTDDRRACDVIITTEGQQLLEQVSNEIGLMNAKIAEVSDKELQLLNDLLDKFRGSQSV